MGTATIFFPLVGATPNRDLELPPFVEFGYVPTKEITSQPFAVTNIGDTQTEFSWTVQAPFRVEPPTASLAPGEVGHFTIFFEPMDAVAISGLATCQIHGGRTLHMRISGIAKFPYLSVESLQQDFGHVCLGTTQERIMRVTNHSPVIANYHILAATMMQDKVFRLEPADAVIPPHDYADIRVLYTPKALHTYSCEDCYLGTAGGNKLTLNLRGTAAPPNLVFAVNMINFGAVEVGESVEKVLYMQNKSPVPVHYDFQIEAHDVFSVSSVKGTIAANITGHVLVTYHAQQPVNSWRRLTCIIKDCDPFAIDLLGTGFDEKNRPVQFHPGHIQKYYKRVTAGGKPVVVEDEGLTRGQVRARPTRTRLCFVVCRWGPRMALGGAAGRSVSSCRPTFLNGRVQAGQFMGKA